MPPCTTARPDSLARTAGRCEYQGHEKETHNSIFLQHYGGGLNYPSKQRLVNGWAAGALGGTPFCSVPTLPAARAPQWGTNGVFGSGAP